MEPVASRASSAGVSAEFPTPLLRLGPDFEYRSEPLAAGGGTPGFTVAIGTTGAGLEVNHNSQVPATMADRTTITGSRFTAISTIDESFPFPVQILEQGVFTRKVEGQRVKFSLLTLLLSGLTAPPQWHRPSRACQPSSRPDRPGKRCRRSGGPARWRCRRPPQWRCARAGF